MVESPCVGICELDNGICIGCDRTVEEIYNWEEMTEEEKIKVIEKNIK